MCPPGLHISLGIFLKLYNLLETACAKLDVRVILQGTDESTYHRYVDAITEQTNLREQLQKEKNLVDGLEKIYMFMSLFFPTPPKNDPTYQNLTIQLSQKMEVVSQLVS